MLGAIGTLESRHVAHVHGSPYEWSAVFPATMPRWVLLAATLPFVLRLAMRFPVVPWRARTFWLHAAIFVVLSFAHAMTDAWGMGVAAPEVKLFFGWFPRVMRSWYNTLPAFISTYAAIHLTAWGTLEARERERRTVRALQLESQLQSARLAALRAQLQPHFLYNTLNGIAALIADARPRHAVAAIEQLGELLHGSLREDGREEVTVDEEVALAGRYLALQQMRFGERLQYELLVDPDAAGAQVPVLILQPIVENAVVHGLDAGEEVLHVRVTASCVPGAVELTVENNGLTRSIDAPRRAGHGVGMAATRARLESAYGARASLLFLPRAEGGAMVRIRLPHQVHGTREAATPDELEAVAT